MRILIHSDEYSPSSGPCANRMKVFVEVLAQKGHSVSVIASAANKTIAPVSTSAVRVLYAPVIPVGSKSNLRRLLNNLSFAISSVFFALRVGSADLVITTSPPPLISVSGWLIAKIKRARLVYDVRDIWPDIALEANSFTENSLYARVFRAIANFMYKQADLVTTVSPGKVNKIASRLGVLGQKEKVVLVSNGFDINTLAVPTQPEVIKEYGLDRDAFCVYIGNVGLAQGLDTMLDLARSSACLPVHFLVFGEGADRARLEEKAQQEGITNIRFCGQLTQDKVPTVLRKAALSFIPLKTANMKDSVPTKLYEALGHGCPVLLMAVGDAAAVLAQTGLGESISPDEADKLPGVFATMLDNQVLYMARRENAMALVRDRYSRQSEAAKLEGLLRTLCEAS